MGTVDPTYAWKIGVKPIMIMDFFIKHKQMSYVSLLNLKVIFEIFQKVSSFHMLVLKSILMLPACEKYSRLLFNIFFVSVCF